MNDWPSLPLNEWRDTCQTLHRWMQIVGKIRLKLAPLVNHFWNVPLYVSARGFTTSAIPYGDRWFEIEFDLIDHQLWIRTNDGGKKSIALKPRSVADVYREIFAALRSLGIEVKIWPMTVEIVDEPMPLDRDETHRSYDRGYAERFWRVVALTESVFTKFRGGFIGKCSPVHFFWGSFDLAVTRFSGRPAPARPDADSITREAYSHEVSSVGFWPGDSRTNDATFYSYAAPEPPGYRDAVSLRDVTYNGSLFGFYLPYDAVRKSRDPEKTLLEFCQTTYNAAADNANWDRAALERH